jgi:hypothetical protein
MIWYSPELDEILLITLKSLEWKDNGIYEIKHGYESDSITDQAVCQSTLWYYVGEL